MWIKIYSPPSTSSWLKDLGSGQLVRVRWSGPRKSLPQTIQTGWQFDRLFLGGADDVELREVGTIMA